MSDVYQQAPGSKGYGPQDWEVVRRTINGPSNMGLRSVYATVADAISNQSA